MSMYVSSSTAILFVETGLLSPSVGLELHTTREPSFLSLTEQVDSTAEQAWSEVEPSSLVEELLAARTDMSTDDVR